MIDVILKYIKAYFTNWAIPLLFNLIVLFIFIAGFHYQYDWIISLGFIVFFANLVGTFISGIIQVIIGKWYFLLLQYAISGVLFLITIAFFALAMPDFYGVHKTIPIGVHFNNPLNQNQDPYPYQFDQYDLIVQNHYQPGLYLYYTDYSPKENGHFYIKAYEFTENDWLSGESIKKESMVDFNLKSNSILKGNFTIYEGSWGDKYGSRIELWFKPTHGDDYKVTERNYMVEGWMR